MAAAAEHRNTGQATADPSCSAGPQVTGLQIGPRSLQTRYFLAPLAGYTHLAFRIMLRRLGGVGLATTDLVQARMLLSETRKSLELVATNDEDRPLSVQIFSGCPGDLVGAARWLQDRGYEGIDINMGCPVARINGAGGGARLMCDVAGAVEMVARVIDAVDLPVTVKMRLGWDDNRITAPELAARLEDAGTAAVTVHGRTRQQGFGGTVCRRLLRETVQAVRRMPVIANGDIRTVHDAQTMFAETGCAAVAVGRGAMLDPWIFRRLIQAERGETPSDPSPDEQMAFLIDHFSLMRQQHGDYSCILFRKFAAWYGCVLGIPEDLEDRLRRFESVAEFDEITEQVRRRHGERRRQIPTALIRVPDGPVSHW